MKTIFILIGVSVLMIFSGQAQALSQTTICTMEYAPVCGEPLVTCPAGALCSRALPKTYSNKCMLTAENAKYFHAGECKGEGLDYNIKDDEKPLPEATDTRHYVADIKGCQIIKYTCEENWDYYSDDIGCGCEKKEVLSEDTQNSINILLEKFIKKLEDKDYSNHEIVDIIDGVSLRLVSIKNDRPEYSSIIQYTIQELENQKGKYTDM